MQGGGMGYGQMRHMGGGGRHQQPMPQRQNNRRNNRFRGGGGGGGRFDNRNPNNQQRPNKEIKPVQPPLNNAPKINAQEQKPKEAAAPTQQPQQQVKQEQQQTKPEPQQTQQSQQLPVAKTVPSTPPNKPQQNQQNVKPQPNQQNVVPNTANQNDNKNIPPKNTNQLNANINQTNNLNNLNKNQNMNNMNKNQNANKNQNFNKNMNQSGGNRGSGSGVGGSGGGGAGGRRQGQDKGGNREEHFMTSKLKEISGSTIDLPPLDQIEQKFSGRNRLYIGNLTNDVTEQELLDLFNQYGETSELFVNKEKNFAFIRIDYKANAEKAKREVDGRMRRGRPLRVRFAPHNAAIKVKNLTPFVSNELLHKSFEVFGKVERAIVKVDERGKSLCEGIVEFARKAGAMVAIRNCSERCFFLTASLRPVIVESYEEIDEIDGYTEKSLPKKSQDYVRSREIGPRFAEQNSFEHEYGTRWKQLYESYKQKEEALRREMHMEEEKLEARMEYAKYEHETELLREQLRQREQDRERQKRSWEMAERQADEQREKDRENLMRQQEDMAQRMRLQEDELRRRQQENTLFMQAQQLNRILDEQEQGMGGGRGYDNSMSDKRGYDGSMSNMGPMSGMGGPMQMDTPYMEHYDQMCGHMGYEDGMGRWDSRQEDYPNKRRRY